jgi:hypothetical protein
VLGAWIGLNMLARAHPSRASDYLVVCAWLVGSLVICLTAIYAHAKTHSPFICRALRERGHDVCPDCGYLLRGLGKEIVRCPECGWVREEIAK